MKEKTFAFFSSIETNVTSPMGVTLSGFFVLESSIAIPLGEITRRHFFVGFFAFLILQQYK